jgi:hypothetical protein
VTVRGTVTGRDGEMRPGVTVWVGGRPVVADSAGHFEAPDVTLPYQLVYKGVYTVDILATKFSFYEGLRSTELKIRLTDSDPGALYNEARVTGVLGGSGEHPQPPGYTTVLIAVDDQGVQVGTQLKIAFGGPSSAFDVPIRWLASKGSSLEIKLYALQHDGSSGSAIESFTGYGLKQLTVSAGATLANQTLTLASVSGRMLTVNATVPAPTFSIDSMIAFYRISSGAPLFGELGVGAANPPVSFLLPKGAAPASVQVTMFDQTGASTEQWVRQIDEGVSTLTLQPPLPIVPEAPAENGAIAPGQTFSWSGPEGDAVYEISLRPKDPPVNSPSWFSFHTAAKSFTLPDLSAFGATLRNDLTYEWYVTSRAPFASADAYFAQAAEGEETFTIATSSSRRAIKLP